MTRPRPARQCAWTLALPIQSDAVEPDDHYLAPADLADRIGAVALPASRQQSARWAEYAGYDVVAQPGIEADLEASAIGY